MHSSLFGLPIHLTSMWIFNCYVIGTDSESITLIDPGIPSVGSRAVQLVTQELSRDASDISTAACTHAHVDHFGGISTVVSQIPTDLDIVLPDRCRQYLLGEEPRMFPLLESSLRFMSVYAEQPMSRTALSEFLSVSKKADTLRNRALQLDFTPTSYVRDGEQFVAASGWETIHTPGHTDDSTCWYHRETATLISGDAVVTQDGVAWFNPEFVDATASKETEERLRALDVQHLLPGHGKPIESSNVWNSARSSLQKPTGNGIVARCSRRLGKWK